MLKTILRVIILVAIAAYTVAGNYSTSATVAVLVCCAAIAVAEISNAYVKNLRNKVASKA